MSTILKRGTVIPAKQTQVFTTTKDMQTSINIDIYEGERALTKDNHLLGKFVLSGIPPAAKGVGKVDVTFELDENSILTVTAQDKASRNKETMSITNEKGRLSKEEIDKMVEEAAKHEKEDQAIRERLSAKHSLENYVGQMRATIEDNDKLADKLSEDDKSTIQDALVETTDWLDSNPEADKDAIDEKMRDLQRVCDPIIASIYGGGSSHDYDDDDDEMYEDL